MTKNTITKNEETKTKVRYFISSLLLDVNKMVRSICVTGLWTYKIMKKIFEILINKCNRETKIRLKLNKAILAIDSTIITSKTQLKWDDFHGQYS